MKNFFLSLKTTVWTLLALICVFFLGSYMMPVHRELHAGMNDGLLFDWVREVALDHPWETGWFFASLSGLALLTVNTVVCSLQAIRGRWSRRDFLLRIAPQIVHIGFLCILLAHLLGAGWGYRVSGVLPEGGAGRLPDGRVLMLDRLAAEQDGAGYARTWTAVVSVYDSDRRVASGVLGPNQPLFTGGAGIYLKSFELEPSPAALLLATRDPGVPWALAGAALFTIGAVMILFLKWKQL
jgi:cytochrome c biogenesis protein ResB